MRTSIKTLADFNKWTPLPLVVYCWVQPTRKNQLSEPILTRVGMARDRAHAEQLIREDRKPPDSMGGLIHWPHDSSARHYRVFSAVWHPTTGF